jgi:acetylornithine deacetylase/succinyl-diaminopimelate desuccinylase-like protein
MRKNSRRISLLFTALCLPLVCASARAASDADIKAQPEVVQLLADYLKIDTTNPPGNERLGAEYLAGVLRKNGLEAEIFDTSPNRSCVYARLKGTGKKKAIVLLNHIDVVPARAEDWKFPPFAGEIHNGELWGRGALDMKGMGIIELEAMLRLKRSGVKLDRDIIFLGTPDEEVGGDHGAKWFKENKPELVKDAEFLLNEGFHIDTDTNGKVLYWGVNVAEKSLIWLKVTAKGDAGHASMPIANSAPNRLVRALTRLVDSPPNPIVLPLVQQYFAQISVNETGKTKEAYADVKKALQNPELRDILLNDKMKRAMLLNTVSLTVLKAGYKTNVIPAEAYA